MLRNMYPPGCRVELEDMEADPYVKLSPGDLGTVQFVDDAGQIHVSWDCGHSLAMVFWCRSLQMCYERGTLAGNITESTGYAI